jgi:ABC-type multidrug transport system permease subunit
MNWKNIEQAGMAFGIWAISVFALIAAAVLLGILILLVSAHVAEAQTPGVITWPGESTSPGTCAIGVIGSAEVYLRLYYDNPNAPEAPIVYNGPTRP